MRSKIVKRIGCSVLSAIMVASLAACGANNDGNADSADGEANQPPVVTVVTADGQEKLQVNDFYMYANEDWINSVELESDEYYLDRNSEALDVLYDRIEEMFENSKPEDYAEDDPMRKLVEFYIQANDEEQRADIAMRQLKEMTDTVLSVKNVSQLQDLMQSEDYSLFNDICKIRYQQTSALNFLPEFDPAPMYDLYADLTDEQYAIINEGIVNKFVILGYSEEEAKRIADNTCAFNELIHEYYRNATFGAIYATDEESYKEVDCTIDLMGIVKALDYFSTDMINQTEYVFFVYDDYISWLNAYVTNDNIEMVRDFYACSVARKLDVYGSNELIAAEVSIMQKLCGAEAIVLDGTEGYENAIMQILYNDEGAVAAEYVSRYVTDEMRNEIADITAEIVVSYKEMIAEIDWLDTVQKERLKNKAGLITYQIGCYNDYNKLEDMEIGETVIDTALSQLKSNRTYGQRMLVEHMNQQENIYTDTSALSLYQNNAFFDIESNSIIVCLGYISDDYLWNDASYEEKLAYFGTVIAHEMGHTYDSNAVGFKKSSEYDDKWDSYWDYYNYSAWKVYYYYDGMPTGFGEVINGSAVYNEGFADIIAMQAVMRLIEKHEDFDYDLFFRSYAMRWGQVIRPEYSKLLWTQDGHVTNHERVNSVLAQCNKFYEIYEVSEDNANYVKPEDRIVIWEYAEE
ncbi:MAG: hypothetical protein MJ130_10480 [Lachnospiraceae bacterium]|nr:hypothetical protein [Lachnospiraceae bacterium]